MMSRFVVSGVATILALIKDSISFEVAPFLRRKN
jgi:hypothetical protein